MKSFKDFNPNSILAFYLCAILPPMLFNNPIIGILSFVGASAVLVSIKKDGSAKSIGICIALPFLSALISAIFVHNGATILFFINNSRITLEAILRGLSTGICIAAIILWCFSFSAIFTSDKLLYVFGSFSPKMALLLSMTLRYIPLIKEQYNKTKKAQISLGLYKDNNLIDKFKGTLKVLSIIVTWALENGIICADSMTARGYGVGKRSYFAIFRWEKPDLFLLGTSAVLGAFILIAGFTKALDIIWYPRIQFTEIGALQIICFVVYTLLSLLPVIIEEKKERTWKSLQSKI